MGEDLFLTAMGGEGCCFATLSGPCGSSGTLKLCSSAIIP